MTMATEISTSPPATPLHPDPLEKAPEQLQKEAQEHARLALIHDTFQPVWLTPTIQIGPILPKDKDALIEYINLPAIHKLIRGPPIPFLPFHAEQRIYTRVQRMSKKGIPLNFAIRDMTREGGKLIGSLTISDHPDEDMTNDDVGYWLAPEYHGQGLMAKAVRMMLYRVSILQEGKRKFNAHSMAGNWASRKTLERAGFVYQPDLDELHHVDGQDLVIWTYRLYLTEDDLAQWDQVPEATPLPEYQH